MKFVFGFIGANLAAQIALLLVCWKAYPVIEASFEVYEFSSGLFYFYAAGFVVTGWFLLSGFRLVILQSGLGRRGQRHNRSRDTR